MTPTSLKKVTVSVLALGAASAAIVFGSFAAWTAQTTNPGNTVTTGELKLGNNKPATALFQADEKAKPGDIGTAETVAITNDGNLPLTVKLTQGGIVNTVGTTIQLQINDNTGTKCIYPAAATPCGTSFGAWTSAPLTAVGGLKLDGDGVGGAWAKDEVRTYAVNWKFDAAADNTTMDKSASFGLTWVGTPS